MDVFLLCFADIPSYFLVLAPSAQEAIADKCSRLNERGVNYGSVWCERATSENLKKILESEEHLRLQLISD